MTDASLLSPQEFVERLRRESSAQYHDHHPFHRAMHAGRLSREQLQAWVANRFYYQTRIPVKDALILAKAEDREFRRTWLRRISDHDGAREGEGGIALWLRLGQAVGLAPDALESYRLVLPGVRFACDAYVELVRTRSLVEAVAASLTELHAPDLMSQRIAAWERHYPFVGSEALEYFRSRVPRAARDGEEALAFVLRAARTRAEQEACVAALLRKTEILWHLLDCVQAAVGPRPEAP